MQITLPLSGAQMPYLDWQCTPLVGSYKVFKTRMELYYIDHSIIDDNNKNGNNLIASGDEGMRRLLASGLAQEQPNTPK